MDAQEAERAGLISRIVATEDTDKIALEAAQTIASYGRVAAMMIKETLGRSFETSLSEGLLFERRAFHACFATEDRVEGMRAFAEKRTAQFNKESLKK
jgi:enoyl-CoA hydratase/carnithine racemase